MFVVVLLAVNVVPVAVVLERPAWNCAALVSSELAPPPKNKLLNFCSLRLKYNCEVNRESNALRAASTLLCGFNSCKAGSKAVAAVAGLFTT